jgi:hypothetical protein
MPFYERHIRANEEAVALSPARESLEYGRFPQAFLRPPKHALPGLQAWINSCTYQNLTIV